MIRKLLNVAVLAGACALSACGSTEVFNDNWQRVNTEEEVIGVFQVGYFKNGFQSNWYLIPESDRNSRIYIEFPDREMRSEFFGARAAFVESADLQQQMLFCSCRGKLIEKQEASGKILVQDARFFVDHAIE